MTTDRRLRRGAIASVLIAVALFILPTILVAAGVPVEAVSFVSFLSLIALLAALVLLAASASRDLRWSLMVASSALAAEVVAALLLLVQEPQPAYLHPEWAWYWPAVNTLYFGGLLLTIVALISSAIAVARTRTRLATVALLLAAGAAAVNRIAPYR